MAELVLEVRDFEGPSRWRWVLTEPGGRFVADHEVRLDPDCWQYEAFGGLYEYLQWHVAPDRRMEHEAEIVGQVGEWIGVEVLGRVGPALVAQRAGGGAGGDSRRTPGGTAHDVVAVRTGARAGQADCGTGCQPGHATRRWLRCQERRRAQ